MGPEHDTLLNCASSAPLGLGIGCSAQPGADGGEVDEVGGPHSGAASDMDFGCVAARKARRCRWYEIVFGDGDSRATSVDRLHVGDVTISSATGIPLSNRSNARCLVDLNTFCGGAGRPTDGVA